MTQLLTCGVIFFCVFGTAVSLCQGLSDSRDVAKTDGRDVMKTRSREIDDMCDLGSCFVFVMFAFKSKVSIILKIKQ